MKEATKPTKPPIIKMRRQILWMSTNGRYVVVEGPFPQGFIRTPDAGSVHSASRRMSTDMVARPATTLDKRYAKTRASYVEAAKNEWGEIGI